MRPSSSPGNNHYLEWVLPDLIQVQESPLAKHNEFMKESKLRITQLTL